MVIASNKCNKHKCVNCKKRYDGSWYCKALVEPYGPTEICPFYKERKPEEEPKKEEVYIPKKDHKPSPLLAIKDDRYKNGRN